MPSSRAVAMCWAEMSASVQWVAIAHDAGAGVVGALAGRAIVPMPGSSSVASLRVVHDLARRPRSTRVGLRAEAVVEARAGRPSPCATSMASTPAASSARGDRAARARG